MRHFHKGKTSNSVDYFVNETQVIQINLKVIQNNTQ